jgi:D-3-phosphoglycerate dehydrogenase
MGSRTERFKPKVVLVTGRYRKAIDTLEENGCEVVVLRDGFDKGLLFKELHDADGLLYGLEPLTKEVFGRSPRLKGVALFASGYDNVDVDAASEHGVYIANAPGANSDAVAEFTFGLILSLVRHIHDACINVRAGGWRQVEFVGIQLKGKVLGIIGFGRIGQTVGRLGRGFGMEVWGYDPFVPDEMFQREGVSRGDLDEVLSKSDILTLHARLTEGARHMIGKKELARMKPTAYLINTARGDLVVEAALLDALDHGRLAGAALDVFSREPPEDRRIRGHPRILTTPHISGWNDVSRYNMGKTAAEQVLMAIRGRRPTNAVNDPPEPRNKQTSERAPT